MSSKRSRQIILWLAGEVPQTCSSINPGYAASPTRGSLPITPAWPACTTAVTGSGSVMPSETRAKWIGVHRRGLDGKMAIREMRTTDEPLTSTGSLKVESSESLQSSCKSTELAQAFSLLLHHLLPLDQSHRCDIHFSPVNHIVYNRNCHNAYVHDNRPIHRRSLDRRCHREEREDIDGNQVAHGGDVDRQTPSSETPAAGREGVSSKALDDQASDDDHVACEQADDGEGEDGVQGDVGADVDKGEEAGYQEGDEYGVQRDLKKLKTLVWMALQLRLFSVKQHLRSSQERCVQSTYSPGFPCLLQSSKADEMP